MVLMMDPKVFYGEILSTDVWQLLTLTKRNPDNNKNNDGSEATTTKLFRAVAGNETPK